MDLDNLASHRRFVEHLDASWPRFIDKRADRLHQRERYGAAPERVAEGILEDLLTVALDWPLSCINSQVDYADMVVTRLGIKYLIIEAKRPGALAWNQRAVEAALDQARRYADEQKVGCVAVSDGEMFYAAEIANGGLRDRVFVPLHACEPSLDLWWISREGIHRRRPDNSGAALRLLPAADEAQPSLPGVEAAGALLHPKYHLPACCFAYVGDASSTSTWKLPYLREDLSIDSARLPKAIQSILSNYRGARVGGIPERAVPAVLLRLAQAAESAGKMPGQQDHPARVYAQLAEVLDQIGADGTDPGG